ncbi:hypothetical protein MCSF7_01891 [Mycoplasmopsis columbina SF7]|uniref:Uncharacterized protein n=1 Tax=Mycoplasmopsis columbina SF7 TaxID=1037410 RepID=F9UKG5_9BACT|nr:hypothetical protein [Mycoplasmopsis columbina]EGV00170.1 hypothetical protein MCSF7_01891 [Mycoplasmopsis columbina SF7]
MKKKILLKSLIVPTTGLVSIAVALSANITTDERNQLMGIYQSLSSQQSDIDELPSYIRDIPYLNQQAKDVITRWGTNLKTQITDLREKITNASSDEERMKINSELASVQLRINFLKKLNNDLTILTSVFVSLPNSGFTTTEVAAYFSGISADIIRMGNLNQSDPAKQPFSLTTDYSNPRTSEDEQTTYTSILSRYLNRTDVTVIAKIWTDILFRNDIISSINLDETLDQNRTRINQKRNLGNQDTTLLSRFKNKVLETITKYYDKANELATKESELTIKNQQLQKYKEVIEAVKTDATYSSKIESINAIHDNNENDTEDFAAFKTEIVNLLNELNTTKENLSSAQDKLTKYRSVFALLDGFNTSSDIDALITKVEEIHDNGEEDTTDFAADKTLLISLLKSVKDIKDSSTNNGTENPSDDPTTSNTNEDSQLLDSLLTKLNELLKESGLEGNFTRENSNAKIDKIKAKIQELLIKEKSNNNTIKKTNEKDYLGITLLAVALGLLGATLLFLLVFAILKVKRHKK